MLNLVFSNSRQLWFLWFTNIDEVLCFFYIFLPGFAIFGTLLCPLILIGFQIMSRQLYKSLAKNLVDLKDKNTDL